MEALPVELLTRVLEKCDSFPQAIALASVSKRSYATWITNSNRIIWGVATNQIRSFDDALMAVRATAIVLKSYEQGIIPPAIVTINSLSGTFRLPDLAELKEVFNMQYLVRCIEFMYFYATECEDNELNLLRHEEFRHYPAERRRFPTCLNEELPGTKNATIDSFRDGFYRAMYRLLLAGAILARAYMAPLFQARGEGDKFDFFTRVGTEDYTQKYWEKLGPSHDGFHKDEDAAYIRQYPVYNYDVTDWSEIGVWKYQEYETWFGPFASWIVEDGRKRRQEAPQDSDVTLPDWADDWTDVSAVRELMLLLVAYDHFYCKFSNRYEMSYECKASYNLDQDNRTVTVVRFGTFKVEQVTLPTTLEDLITGHLFTTNHPALDGTAGEDIPLQFQFWAVIEVLLGQRLRSPRLTTWDDLGPSPMFELWNFALRRYLNLGFKAGTFWGPRRPRSLYEQCTWYKEVGRGEIFINPNWAVVQRYEPGVASWRQNLI